MACHLYSLSILALDASIVGIGKMKLNTVITALVQNAEEGRMIIMNNDLIERQAAIDMLDKITERKGEKNEHID